MRSYLQLSLLAAGVGASAVALAWQAQPAASAKSRPEGRQIFAASCASCHGLDGRGGERAPDIAGRREVQRLSSAALARIVGQGIPGTGMPSFPSLGSARIQAVVGYLRALQGKNSTGTLPGNPENGKSLFFGKAECSTCHLVEGQGGFLGSDLSAYATALPPDAIRRAISNPNQEFNRHSRLVVVTTRSGQKVTGLARNEDNFSLQLQTLDGAYHLYSKQELESLERQPQSIMPSDYANRLDQREIDDLVSYLMSQGRKHKLVTAPGEASKKRAPGE